MLYSEKLLKGALSRVWQAAHLESKLTKQNILQADIEQNVKDILETTDESIGLRVSGSLLLGVCRIYYRKANYLLADCNETLVTIKMQIRPALVDLPEDQLAAPRNDITRNVGDDLGLDMDWSATVLDFQPAANHIARPGDINLAGHEAFFPYDDFDAESAIMTTEDGFFSQDFDLGLLDDDEARDDDDDETVELGRDAASAKSGRMSMGSAFGAPFADDMSMDFDGGRPSGGLDIPFDPDVDLGFMEPDFDMDAGGGYAGPDVAGGADFQGFDVSAGNIIGPPASSRLTTPPTEANGSVLTSLANLSPTTAARVSALANKKQASTVKKKASKHVRVQIDENTELAGSQGARPARERDLSSILTAQRFIPSSTSVIRLLQIRSDPLAHYLPSRPGPGGDKLIYTGPPGLGDELASMFFVPAAALRRQREQGDEEEAEAARKRARTEEGEGDEDSVELGRRASHALSAGPGSVRGGDEGGLLVDDRVNDDLFGDMGYGDEGMGGMAVDEFNDFAPFDVDDTLPVDGTPRAGAASRRRRSNREGSAGSLLDDELEGRDDLSFGGPSAGGGGGFPSSPASHVSRGALGMFDTVSSQARRGGSEGPSRSQRAGSHSRTSRAGSAARSVTGASATGGGGGAAEAEDETERERARNISRNTARALGLLRKELGDEFGDEIIQREGQDPIEPKKLSFNAISTKSTKRAASAFFFELLVLGTKDCVKLEQPEAYADIDVRAKPKLWEVSA